jgi:hypothetical protein
MVTPREHFGWASAIPSPRADEAPKPGQIDVPSSKELHSPPDSSISPSPHHLQKQSPFVKHDLGIERAKLEKNHKYTDDWRF